MKLIILACSMFLILALPLAAEAQTASRISITSTLESVRITRTTRVSYFLLWNREITPTPLGHAFLTCHRAPLGVWTCNSTYTLPYGRLATMGEAHHFRRYSLIIVGGTRSKRAVRESAQGYQGVAGTLTTWRIGPGTYRLAFAIQ